MFIPVLDVATAASSLCGISASIHILALKSRSQYFMHTLFIYMFVSLICLPLSKRRTTCIKLRLQLPTLNIVCYIQIQLLFIATVSHLFPSCRMNILNLDMPDWSFNAVIYLLWNCFRSTERGYTWLNIKSRRKSIWGSQNKLERSCWYPCVSLLWLELDLHSPGSQKHDPKC